MKRSEKRLAWLMAMVMLFSLLPLQAAWATEGESEHPAESIVADEAMPEEGEAVPQPEEEGEEEPDEPLPEDEEEDEEEPDEPLPEDEEENEEEPDEPLPEDENEDEEESIEEEEPEEEENSEEDEGESGENTAGTETIALTDIDIQAGTAPETKAAVNPVAEEEKTVKGETLRGMNILDSGSLDVGLFWTLTYDGTLTVSGRGDIPDFDPNDVFDQAPWMVYETDGMPIRKVVIGAGVSGIGKNAFYECTSLSDVSIPDTVTVIGDSAFYKCNALTGISIPDSVTAIGTNAFSLCWRMTSVTLPGGITAIEAGVFQACEMLGSIEIPAGVTTIDESAFAGAGIEEIVLPTDLKTIGINAFYRCRSLAKITFTGDMPAISDNAFNGVTATVHYPADNTTYTNLGGYGGELTWTADAVRDAFWNDGSVFDAMTIDGGTEEDPFVIHVLGSVTLNGPVMINGVAELVGEGEGSRQLLFTSDGSQNGISLTGDSAASLKIRNLTLYTTGTAGEGSGGAAVYAADSLCELELDNVVIDGFAVGIRADNGFPDDNGGIVNRTIIRNSVLQNNHTAVAGSADLHYCTVSGSDAAFEQTGFIRLYNCTVTGNTAVTAGNSTLQLTDTAIVIPENGSYGSGGRLLVSGAAKIDPVDLRCTTVFVSGELINDAGITVCNSQDKVAAGAYGGYSITNADAQCFRYRPNADEQNDGGVYRLYTDSETNKIMISVSFIEQEAAEIDSRSLTLEGNIGINFYVKLPTGYAADDGAYATLNGTARDIPEPEKDGTYKFTYYVTAKQQHDDVVIRFFNENGAYPLRDKEGNDLPDGYALSVAGYCELARNALSSDTALLAMLDRMTEYGIYAQLQFGYDTASAIITPDMNRMLDGVSAADLAKFRPEIPSFSEGIEYAGATLVLQTETTIRQYFRITAGEAGDYQFLVNGVPVRPVKAGEEYFVAVTNIPAQDLEKPFSVTVRSADGTAEYGTISNYSALSYVYLVLKNGNGSPNLVNTVKGLYLYNQAADIFFATLS